MNEAIRELQKMVDQARSQKAAAEELGISAAYLGDILAGRTHISDRIANKLGFRWMLISNDPALEAYLQKFCRAPEGTQVIPVGSPDQESHDIKEQ